MSCPLCGSDGLTTILRRNRLPAMQNVTYATREQAVAAQVAPFELQICRHCGFLFNARFDSGLLKYDTDYDNHVESRTFLDYYESISRMLGERFDLDRGGIVYDIGCGQGTFLKVLCSVFPQVEGIGIDPSCEPGTYGNVKLIRSVFHPDVISQAAKVVVLRHVLEHIWRPVDFLLSLRAAIRDVPLFVEVPESNWIRRNRAFWDFCYEHCNYFVPESLRSALVAAGFEPSEQAASFGDQYQWALCRSRPMSAPPFDGDADALVSTWKRYGDEESASLESARSVLTKAASEGPCVLWGMATKGVVFASMMEAGVLDAGIDSNPRKQGRFAAVSGIPILAPSSLARHQRRVQIFVMNPNYLEEIRAQVRAIGVDADVRVA
jgi:hypothetical protein